LIAGRIDGAESGQRVRPCAALRSCCDAEGDMAGRLDHFRSQARCRQDVFAVSLSERDPEQTTLRSF
jgi:hypothetical protein